MKRCVILLLLLMVSTISAAPSLKFQNEEIKKDETIIATITAVGEFTKEIEVGDIVFYEGRKEKLFDYDLFFYEGIHYLYIYASRLGEFTIHINDIYYEDANGLNYMTIIKPFNITSGIEFDEELNDNISRILNVRPGFIYMPENDKIRLVNKGTVPLELEYKDEAITLEPLAIKEILINSSEEISYFNISGYRDFSIPIIDPSFNISSESPVEDSDTENESIVEDDLDLAPNPNLESNIELLVTELLTETIREENIILSNFGNHNINNLRVFSDISFAEFGELEDMGVNETQNLTIKFEAEETGSIQGTINVSYNYLEEEYILEIPVNLFILPEGTSEEVFEEVFDAVTKEEFEILGDTCEGLNGVVCKTGTLCDGEQDFTSEGSLCCFGICKAKEVEKKEKSIVGTIVAVFIILGLVGYGYYAYKKQKNLKKNKPEDKLKESSEKFTKRMSGNSEPTRVTGTLSKS
jgi:hypothetical protein